LSEIIQYKGKPLARNGNKIFYGNPEDKYILVLTILDSNGEVATRVNIQVWDTDPELALKNEKIVKEGEKKDLCEAMDFGIAWLSSKLLKAD